MHRFFSDATTHLYKRSRPSVHPLIRRSVSPSVRPVLFSKDKYGRFERNRSSNDIVNNDTMSDDEEVASDVPPRYLFDFDSIQIK